MYIIEYIPILHTFFCALFLSSLLLLIAFILAPKNSDMEKLSAYECGFESYGDARIPFDVKFYLVAILFIIFDIEIAYFFPWCLVAFNLTFEGFFNTFIFLFILTIGFIYEWVKGALDWS
jgi:NADH-quinone oxidoreductase subunit A